MYWQLFHKANAIYLELELMGFKAWYDNRANDLTKEGMLEGIEQAAAFVLFLSVGVLERPYCQMEIRHALALKKPIVLLHESDTRYAAFNFSEAHDAAPPDLQRLLDSHESLPFRRRGYERDGMMRTLIERAGFQQLLRESVEAQGSSDGVPELAAVPSELSHVALETFHERPVQAELIEVLLLPNDDRRFMSCVVVHGMGGTGKTVTAVAAVRDKAVRQHYSEIFWLTVGADAVGERISQLQMTLFKQLTGKAAKSEETNGQELQRMLVTAMAEKQRALLVLDDPWMPEQVRLLNPIDSSQTEDEHRLLVTTRIRDLVPKATRVELPLMGKNEAVALLLDLANVDEAEYRKENPQSAWPPPEAYTIVSECGLLPITLTIAAQVVRSWGEGWETAVLPLLREEEHQDGKSSSTRSTVEGRVIGAGLQALAKDKDGTAVKTLFHMFAVTQEDFVHSMAVIELLWRSCCASDSERGEGGLAARLKYLRKQLTPDEMRAEQQKVVWGMLAASRARATATGSRGFQDTGSMARAFEGEEVDWYCRNVGAFHLNQALDPSIALEDNDVAHSWLLGDDIVLARSAAVAIGLPNLESLSLHFEEDQAECLSAAKVHRAIIALLGGSMAAGSDGEAHMKAILRLLAKSDSTLEGGQLELDLLVKTTPLLMGEEKKRVDMRIKVLLESGSLHIDPVNQALTTAWPEIMAVAGAYPFYWNEPGFEVTEEGLARWTLIAVTELTELVKQGIEVAIGARKETCLIWYHCVIVGFFCRFFPTTDRVATIATANTNKEWGHDGSPLKEACSKHVFARHHEIFVREGFNFDSVMGMPSAEFLLELKGALQTSLQVYAQAQQAAFDYLEATSPPLGISFPMFFIFNLPYMEHRTEIWESVRPRKVRLFDACGCQDTKDVRS
eukprot:g1692.t1